MNKKVTNPITVYALTSLLSVSSCANFEQNQFVLTETIANEPKEHIFYNVYRTGLDNYRFEFLSNNGADTSKLFDYYLNNAIYTVMDFKIARSGDTLKITTKYPTEQISLETKNNLIVMLTNE